MKQYIIERLEDGGATVSEIVPQQIASFTCELHAEAFVAMLSGAEKGHERTSPPPAAEPDWHAAFERLEAGENLSEVAADIGVKMEALRGKWGARRRSIRNAEEGERRAVERGTSTVHVKPGSALDDYTRRPERSSILTWSEEDDVAVATAAEADYPALAERLGKTVELVRARADHLARQIAKEMNDV